jgi:hypothetical protein
MAFNKAFYESARRTVRDDAKGSVSLAEIGDRRLGKLLEGLRAAADGRRKALKEMHFPDSLAGQRCKDRFAEETAKYVARLKVLEAERNRRMG